MRKILIWDDINQIKGLKKFNLNKNELLSERVEYLMCIGRLITLDIRDLNLTVIQQLLHLVERYNYKLYCKAKYREDTYIKLIPQDKVCIISNYQDMEDKVVDLSSYEKVVHIGDIHGCYNVLKEAWDKHYSDKNYYIFIGDYIDRGKQNVEVLKFLFEIYKLNNVCLIEGNHDGNLYYYSKDNPKSYSDIKFTDTRKEIEKSDITKEQINQLCKSFREVLIYTYKDKKVIATHGGVPKYPDKMYEINSEDIIRGQLNDFENVDKLFIENTSDKRLYQVHGHSNLFNMEPDKFKRSINLEGGVEIGGHLVLWELSEKGVKTFKYKNKNSIMINYFK